MSGLATSTTGSLHWVRGLPPQGHDSHHRRTRRAQSRKCGRRKREGRDLRCSPRPATKLPATSTQAVSSGDAYARTLLRQAWTQYLYPAPGRSPLTASIQPRRPASPRSRGDGTETPPRISRDCSTGCCRGGHRCYDRSWPRTAAAKRPSRLPGRAGLAEILTYWGMAHVQPHTPADPAWLRPGLPRPGPAGRASRATSTDSP